MQLVVNTDLHNNLVESCKVLRTILLPITLLTCSQSFNHQQVAFNGVRLSQVNDVRVKIDRVWDDGVVSRRLTTNIRLKHLDTCWQQYRMAQPTWLTVLSTFQTGTTELRCREWLSAQYYLWPVWCCDTTYSSNTTANTYEIGRLN